MDAGAQPQPPQRPGERPSRRSRHLAPQRLGGGDQRLPVHPDRALERPGLEVTGPAASVTTRPVALPATEMIWRVLSCYADLAGQDIRLSATAAYAMLDGLFQQALLGHVAGRADALDGLSQQVRGVIPLMLTAGGRTTRQVEAAAGSDMPRMCGPSWG